MICTIRRKLLLCLLLIIGSNDIAFAQNRAIKLIDDKALIDKLNTMQRPTIFVMYASWCMPCRSELPKIVSLIQKHSKLFPLILSIDHNESDLQHFLYKQKLINFTPYYLPKKEHLSHLARRLRTLGLSFNNTIPFAVLIDRNNYVINIEGKSDIQLEHLIHKLK